MTRTVTFQPCDGGWYADAGDGLLGPSGTVPLELDGVVFEFDRSFDRPLVSLAIDGDVCDEQPSWLGQMLTEPTTLRDAAGPHELGLRVSDPWLETAATCALIEAELAELALDRSPRADAFRFAANLELAPLLRELGNELEPAGLVAMAARGAERAVSPPADVDAVWDRIRDPRLPDDVLIDLLRGAAATGVDRALLWLEHSAPRVDVVDRAPTVSGTPTLAFRGGAIRKGPGRERDTPVPRHEVADDGTFVVRANAVLSHDARGRVVADGGPPGYHVSIEGVARGDVGGRSHGPLWVRLYGELGLVAGGPIETDDTTGHAYVDLPFPAGGPRKAHSVDVWANPYRFPTAAALDRPFRIGDLAREAAARGRRAARLVGPDATRAWVRCAETWLAAGYLDRAALAFGLAGDEQAGVWVRARQARRRLERHRRRPAVAPPPLCLHWHPDRWDEEPT